jgi:hypothetical protein
MTARYGYYQPRPIRSLALTPEAALTVQDSPEFKALLAEYYARFPYMRPAVDLEETEAEFTARMMAKEIEPVHHMPANADNPDYFEMF